MRKSIPTLLIFAALCGCTVNIPNAKIDASTSANVDKDPTKDALNSPTSTLTPQTAETPFVLPTRSTAPRPPVRSHPPYEVSPLAPEPEATDAETI